MLNKINDWWNTHIHEIAMWMTLLAMCEVIVIILTMAGFISMVDLMHNIEVQLTAHGVDWALYTPIP